MDVTYVHPGKISEESRKGEKEGKKEVEEDEEKELQIQSQKCLVF